MREVGVVEAEKTFKSLLDLVADGEEVLITRRGKAVARLVREEGFVDRETARRAAADIAEAAKGVTLGGLDLRDLIEDGRP
jgi:prevent-host-death family protein